MYNCAVATCKACAHRDREALDEAYARSLPIRSICERFGLSIGCAHRHKAHVRALLADAARRAHAESPERGATLLARIEQVIDGAKGIASRAVRSDQLGTANAALGTILRSLELLGRLNGELQAPGGIHIHHNKTVNVVTINDSDVEVAVLVGEATDGFNVEEFQRLKLLAERSTSRSQPDVPE